MNTAFVQDYADVEIVARQREAITDYARNHGIKVDAWVVASDFLPESLNTGDMLLLEKTFRLAKDVRTIALLLERLLNRGVLICSCEDDLRFGGESETTASLAELFGVVAKVAEELRSQLTKEGLEDAKAAGQVLGRPRGRLNKRTKLTGRDEEIAQLLKNGYSRNKIAQMMHVHPNTLNGFIKKDARLSELTNA